VVMSVTTACVAAAVAWLYNRLSIDNVKKRA
jgi:hypothetical protein